MATDSNASLLSELGLHSGSDWDISRTSLIEILPQQIVFWLPLDWPRLDIGAVDGAVSSQVEGAQ